MRIEKSGVGDSQGPPCVTVDLAAEERAYAAALEALRADSHVDARHVYLFGHSIGSEAPALAANVPVAELPSRKPSDAIGRSTRCAIFAVSSSSSEQTIEQTMPGCKTPNAASGAHQYY